MTKIVDFYYVLTYFLSWANSFRNSLYECTFRLKLLIGIHALGHERLELESCYIQLRLVSHFLDQSQSIIAYLLPSRMLECTSWKDSSADLMTSFTEQ